RVVVEEVDRGVPEGWHGWREWEEHVGDRRDAFVGEVDDLLTVNGVRDCPAYVSVVKRGRFQVERQVARRGVEVRVGQIWEPRLDILIGLRHRLEHATRHMPERIHVIGDGFRGPLLGVLYA